MSEAVENPTREFVLKPVISAPARGTYKPTIIGTLAEVVDGKAVARSEPYPFRIGAKRGQTEPRYAWGGTRAESDSLAAELLWRIGATNEAQLKWLKPALAQTLADVPLGREIEINAQLLEDWAAKGVRLLAAGVKPQAPPLKDIQPIPVAPALPLESSIEEFEFEL